MRDARNVDYLENACFKTSELFLIFSLNILDNEEVYFFWWAWQEERKPQKYYSRSLHFFFDKQQTANTYPTLNSFTQIHLATNKARDGTMNPPRLKNRSNCRFG